MIRALSTAATGMEAQQTRLEVTANNIANVSTAGFKKSRAEFQDLMYQRMREATAASPGGYGSPAGVEVGLGVRPVSTQRMQSEGDLQQTGNPYDVAIQGNGFFQIQQPNGQVAYTRDGSFKVSPEGRLVTTDGLPLATDISLPPDAQSVTIGADGTVTATLAGSSGTPVQLGQIQLATFVNPAGLNALGGNLLQQTSASGPPTPGAPGQNGIGTLAQGTLEMSNVQVVQEMVDLIAGQRAYEVNSRVVKAADEMLQETAQLQ